MNVANRRKTHTRIADNSVFDLLSGLWWSENGYFNMLKSMVNPWRVGFLKRIVSSSSLQPSGLSLLDIGCGGGLLTEELSRMGFSVTGIDRSKESLLVAREHAMQGGLCIDYQIASAESLPFREATFDVVTCCDVLEHIPNWKDVIKEISSVLRPNGLFFYDTINRTAASRLLFVEITQNCPITRIAPPNLHVWEMFITPRELIETLGEYNLRNMQMQGARVGTNFVRAFLLIQRYRRGRITGAQLGQQLQLIPHSSLSLSYSGFAVKRS
jgi:2-polyprenyl-6-hydroxyphenyl methylase/3-demethylubiquinone-9 3-methyltransferase